MNKNTQIQSNNLIRNIGKKLGKILDQRETYSFMPLIVGGIAGILSKDKMIGYHTSLLTSIIIAPMWIVTHNK